MKWGDENTYGDAENDGHISKVWDPFKCTTKLVQINQVVNKLNSTKLNNWTGRQIWLCQPKNLESMQVIITRRPEILLFGGISRVIHEYLPHLTFGYADILWDGKPTFDKVS